MFLPNTETDKSRNTKTETYFGQNIWPKPNRNDIRLSTNSLVVYLMNAIRDVGFSAPLRDVLLHFGAPRVEIE